MRDKFNENDNKDISEAAVAVACLSQFCNTFCIDTKATDETDDLVFRCKECPFKDSTTNICSVKLFINKYSDDSQRHTVTAMGTPGGDLIELKDD